MSISGKAAVTANATLYTNGQEVSTVNGEFNVSLTMGQYYKIEATASGYQPYYDNMTVANGTTHITPLSITLTKVQKKVTPSSFPVLDIAIIAVVIIVVGIIVVIMMGSKGRKTAPPSG